MYYRNIKQVEIGSVIVGKELDQDENKKLKLLFLNIR